MPNYGLQINSQFQPFTMDELLRPVMSATQSYRETEDAYGKLKTEAEQLRYISNILRDANTKESRAAADKYDTYYTQLEASANELMETGNIRTSRKALWDTMNSYARDILPMKTGYEALAKKMETQAATPNVAYRYKYSMSDLPSFISDPSGMTLGENNAVDLTTVSKLAEDAYSSLAQRFRDFTKNPTGKIDTFTDYLVENYGLSDAEINTFINNPTYEGVLGAISKNVLQRSGINIEDFDNWQDRDKILGTIALAANQARGKDAVKIMEDFEARQNYKGNTDNPSENDIILGTKSYLNTSGNEAKYNTMIDNMFPPDKTYPGDPVIAYPFNENISVQDAIKGYEDLQAALEKNNPRHTQVLNDIELSDKELKGITARAQNMYGQSMDDNTPYGKINKRNAEKYIQDEITRLKVQKIEPYLRNEYGVDRFLTDDEYEMLKDLGYNQSSEEKIKSKEDLHKGLNKQAQTRTSYSISLADYGKLNDKVIPELLGRGDKGIKGLIYKVDTNGRKGEDVEKLSDLGIDPQTNPIVDVSYMEPSDFNDFGSAKCIIKLRNGSEYLMPISVIDSGLSDAVSYYESIGIGEGDDKFRNNKEKTTTIARMMSQWLRGNYNPVKTKTSSKVE